ncbi:MAG TPA: hypothetical protein VK914_03205 [bacterium]|nr:hypothetical protein [bacterium]
MKHWTLVLAASLALSGCAVEVVVPSHHPAYLHALADLRAARWALNHNPGGYAAIDDQTAAVAEINAAIGAIKQAAFDDNKNPDTHARADEALDYRGRLHRALDLLNDAHRDLAQREDNMDVIGLRNNSIEHVVSAAKLVKQSMYNAHF